MIGNDGFFPSVRGLELRQPNRAEIAQQVVLYGTFDQLPPAGALYEGVIYLSSDNRGFRCSRSSSGSYLWLQFFLF